MKSIALMAALLTACLFVTNGYGQQTSQTGPDRPAAAGHQERAGKDAKRAEAKHAFGGRVVRIDVPAAIFSLEENGITVGFDASNPVFSGYRSLSDMHIGDRAAASYTADGIRVTKLSGRPSPVEKGEIQTERQAAAGKRAPVVGRLLKREKKRDETGFSDADINKDGRITPIGLSVVIKNVTMDEFRQYDRKHKGYLNKSEFLEAVRHLGARER